MSDDLIKKAADMLLEGASMLAQPCPYCGGVRVIKNGNALCTRCGRKPDKTANVPKNTKSTNHTLKELESRLVEISQKLGTETDDVTRKALLDEIGALRDEIIKISAKK